MLRNTAANTHNNNYNHIITMDIKSCKSTLNDNGIIFNSTRTLLSSAFFCLHPSTYTEVHIFNLSI